VVVEPRQRGDVRAGRPSAEDKKKQAEWPWLVAGNLLIVKLGKLRHACQFVKASQLARAV